jgi:hypothetical protein
MRRLEAGHEVVEVGEEPGGMKVEGLERRFISRNRVVEPPSESRELSAEGSHFTLRLAFAAQKAACGFPHISLRPRAGFP